MIGALFGTVHEVRNGVALIVTSHVGYEVHVSNGDWTETSSGPYPFNNPSWWIHEHAPQDAPHELYGFEKREDRDLFRRLLNIKGVGPKVAQRIVASGVKPGDFASGIEAQRMAAHQRLTKIRGVGATLAQRIAEEMK